MSNQDETGGWFTTQQVADKLGVTARRVRQLIDEQQWPHRYLNPRLILIDPEAIEDYMRRQADKGE